MSCVFCEIAAGKLPAEIVWRSEDAVAFLDSRPLFPGHILLIPIRHTATLADLPAAEVGPLFQAVQKLESAVERALDAQGTFMRSTTASARASRTFTSISCRAAREMD